MLDIKFIRENPEKVQKASAAKGVTITIVDVAKTRQTIPNTPGEVQIFREEKNTVCQKYQGKPTPEQLEKGKKIKEAA